MRQPSSSRSAHSKDAPASERSSVESENADHSEVQPRPTQSQQSLGKRIIGWTNNLLASALVLLIAVTFGWQAIRSWHRSETGSSPEPGSAPSLDATAVSWTLGPGSGHWSREEIRADRNGIRQATIARLIEVLEQRDESLGFQSPGASRLLTSLARRPAAWESELGVVYWQEGPIPLALAAAESSESNSGKTVVAWALALPGPAASQPQFNDDNELSSARQGTDPVVEPQPENESELDYAKSRSADERIWALTVCRKVTSDDALGEPFQLPAELQMTFAVNDPQGGQVIGFRSTLSPEAFQRTIDQFIQARQQKALRWNVQGNHLSATSLDHSSLVIQASLDRDGIGGVWTERFDEVNDRE